MKKTLLIGKVILITFFGFLGLLSLLLFPNLIENSNALETKIIGYTYLGLLLTSISVLYFVVKKELKDI
jgi:hypothetical protein